MQLFGHNKRRSETLLLAITQLVLIAYLFQVAAFDHWGINPGTDVAGVAGSSTHQALHAGHCHGSPASCADAGGGFAQLAVDHIVRLPASLPSLAIALDAGTSDPSEPFIRPQPEPPRAA